jgi:uncharacterized membrane protein YsdA (DUF1294 family)
VAIAFSIVGGWGGAIAPPFTHKNRKKNRLFYHYLVEESALIQTYFLQVSQAAIAISRNSGFSISSDFVKTGW